MIQRDARRVASIGGAFVHTSAANNLVDDDDLRNNISRGNCLKARAKERARAHPRKKVFPRGWEESIAHRAKLGGPSPLPSIFKRNLARGAEVREEVRAGRTHNRNIRLFALSRRSLNFNGSPFSYAETMYA